MPTPGQQLGLSDDGVIRRGKSIIDAEQSINLAAGGGTPDGWFLMPTPDRVSSIRVETGGLVEILFQGLWALAVTGTRGGLVDGTQQAMAQLFITGTRDAGPSDPFIAGVQYRTVYMIPATGIANPASRFATAGLTAHRYRPFFLNESGWESDNTAGDVDAVDPSETAPDGLAGVPTPFSRAGLHSAALRLHGLLAGTYNFEIRYGTKNGNDWIFAKRRRLYVKTETY